MERRIYIKTVASISTKPNLQKGDIIICKNCREISIINTSYKVFSNIILNRLVPYVKEIVRENQSGFTTGKSTTDRIHIIEQITEKNKINQKLKRMSSINMSTSL